MNQTSKIPEITLAFWLIKIAATTLGETFGDAVSMSMNLGYITSSLLFFFFFSGTVTIQIRSKKFHPLLYWTVIIATTTTGTTMADFADRSLGLGYFGGSLILFSSLMAILGTWYLLFGSVSVSKIKSPKIELFYWLTILFSNTLGTALGDWFADAGAGFGGGSMIFAGLISLLAVVYRFTNLSRTFLFWATFILTRPLGATLGDLLTKPHDVGGLDLSRFSSSFVIMVFMIILILLTSHRMVVRKI